MERKGRRAMHGAAAQPGITIFGDHFEEDDSYGHARPSGMRDWLIAFTLQGEGFFRTPAGEKRCGEGQIALLRSGVPHAYGTVHGKRWNFVWVHFQHMPEISYLPEEEVYIHTLPEGPQRERVLQAFRHVLHDSVDRTGYWEQLCYNSLRDIMLLMAQSSRKRLDARIEQTILLLARRMKEPLRIEEIAAEVGLSASRLSHLFKQETGMTIVEHMNRLRIGQAALLLKHSGRNATEASLDVGFNNYNHFAELFRRMYGVSPSRYRTDRTEE